MSFSSSLAQSKAISIAPSHYQIVRFISLWNNYITRNGCRCPKVHGIPQCLSQSHSQHNSSMYSTVKAMPTVQYAQQVASEVLKPKPRAWFWLANMTTVSWLLNTFFPKTLLVCILDAECLSAEAYFSFTTQDKIMARQFGLDDFAARSVQKKIVLSPTVKRTVLITGCSAGGIGHALAKEFHSRGTPGSFELVYERSGALVFHLQGNVSLPQPETLNRWWNWRDLGLPYSNWTSRKSKAYAMLAINSA